MPSLATPGTGPGGRDPARLWKLTRPALGAVTQPVLIYRSTVDHVVGPASMKVLEAGLAPALLTLRTCSDSYHVATMDNDAQAIFTEACSLSGTTDSGLVCNILLFEASSL